MQGPKKGMKQCSAVLPSGHHVRVGHQPQDHPRSRPDDPAEPPVPGGRGHQVEGRLRAAQGRGRCRREPILVSASKGWGSPQPRLHRAPPARLPVTSFDPVSVKIRTASSATLATPSWRIMPRLSPRYDRNQEL
jgi:hypothetical protein